MSLVYYFWLHLFAFYKLLPPFGLSLIKASNNNNNTKLALLLDHLHLNSLNTKGHWHFLTHITLFQLVVILSSLMKFYK